MKRLFILLAGAQLFCTIPMHAMENQKVTIDQIVQHVQTQLGSNETHCSITCINTDTANSASPCFLLSIKGFDKQPDTNYKNSHVILPIMFDSNQFNNIFEETLAIDGNMQKQLPRIDDKTKEALKNVCAQNDAKDFDKNELKKRVEAALRNEFSTRMQPNKTIEATSKTTIENVEATSRPEAQSQPHENSKINEKKENKKLFTPEAPKKYPWLPSFNNTVMYGLGAFCVVTALVYYREVVAQGVMTFLRHGIQGFFAKR